MAQPPLPQQLKVKKKVTKAKKMTTKKMVTKTFQKMMNK
jgi:hypothetical protein